MTQYFSPYFGSVTEPNTCFSSSVWYCSGTPPSKSTSPEAGSVIRSIAAMPKYDW